jgi:hypothetical protein
MQGIYKMKKNLGGWLRLWISLTLIYGCAVVSFSWIFWPHVEDIPHRVAFEEMSPEALTIILLSKKRSVLESLLADANSRGDAEEARSLAKQIEELDMKRNRAEIDDFLHETEIVLPMPNGHEFAVAADTTTEDQQLVINDYMRALKSGLRERRTIVARDAFLFWSIPIIIIFVLGAATGWVYRGFVPKGGRS